MNFFTGEGHNHPGQRKPRKADRCNLPLSHYTAKAKGDRERRLLSSHYREVMVVVGVAERRYPHFQPPVQIYNPHLLKLL